MKYKDLIEKMTLEEKASFMSGKDFWQTQDMERLGINSMFLADGHMVLENRQKLPTILD